MTLWLWSKKVYFLWLFIAIKFELSLVITFMAFYDCVRTLQSIMESKQRMTNYVTNYKYRMIIITYSLLIFTTNDNDNEYDLLNINFIQ